MKKINPLYILMALAAFLGLVLYSKKTSASALSEGSGASSSSVASFAGSAVAAAPVVASTVSLRGAVAPARGGGVRLNITDEGKGDQKAFVKAEKVEGRKAMRDMSNGGYSIVDAFSAVFSTPKNEPGAKPRRSMYDISNRR